jgi:hypothetical protein
VYIKAPVRWRKSGGLTGLPTHGLEELEEQVKTQKTTGGRIEARNI